MIQDVELSIGPWQTSIDRPIDPIFVRFQSHLEPNTRAAIAGPFQDVRKGNKFSTGATLAATDLWFEYSENILRGCVQFPSTQNVLGGIKFRYLYVHNDYVHAPHKSAVPWITTGSSSKSSSTGPENPMATNEQAALTRDQTCKQMDLYHLKMFCLNAHVIEYTQKLGFVLQ